MKLWKKKLKDIYWIGKEDTCVIAISKKFLRTVIRRKVPLLDSCIKVIVGERLIAKLHKKYGAHTQLLFMRGATGDVYIQFMVFNNWIRENNTNSYIIVSDALSMTGVAELFPEVEKVAIRGYFGDCIEKAFMLLGEEYLRLKVLFLWTYSLYITRCRVRMIEKFNFMDTYRWYVLGLKGELHFEMPHFKEIESHEIEKLGLIKNKTVIIAPEANSVTQLSIAFWNEIIDQLKELGFRVLVNCNHTQEYHTETLFFKYSKGVPILEYAGCFVGIRSGLCDILSTAQCRKIIIYPKKAVNVNYNEHRSEIEFCGLRVMGLVGEDNNLIEVETPLVRNITQKECEIKDGQQYRDEMSRLQNIIINNILYK